MVGLEQEPLENFPDIEWEPPFRIMGRLILTAAIDSLKELVQRDLVGQDEIVERLRREGF